mmetsp:Transcript_114847/g.214971  ORF Transcript_114847/g.214971 Transcript_114847/m.214971 type:complete len:164 (+) Transcript_114847:80-571(+)
MAAVRLCVRALAQRTGRFGGVLACRPPVFNVVAARTFSDIMYSKTHEWIRKDGDHFVMGISAHAAHAIGDIGYCELPSEGATFKAQEAIVSIEGVKAVGEVYAPADCEVVSANEKLDDEPALINSQPEADGWLLKLKVTGSFAPGMMDSPEYEKMLAEIDGKK